MSTFIWYTDRYEVVPDEEKENSHTYAFVAPLSPAVTESIGDAVPVVKDAFGEIATFLEKLSAKNQPDQEVEFYDIDFR